MSNGYKVGYKKPPVATQFKPGQSGCRDGGAAIKRKKKEEAKRKAAKRTVGDVVLDVVNAPCAVTINGKPTTLSNFDVIVRKIAEEAKAGDRHARKDLTALMKAVGLIKPPGETGGQRTGVLVVTPILPEKEWERRTEGWRLPKNPLEGIPGAEGMLPDENTPRRGTPEEDDE